MSIAATMDRITPAHPTNVRARTTVPIDDLISTLVHMRNRDDWPREEFLAWLDEERDRAGFKHDLDLAEAAGISHSSISGWRNGRQKPSTPTLTKVAKALGKPPREVWLRAGAMEQEDLGGHEPAADDRRAIQMIRDSKLSEPAKKMLIERYLEKVRRAERELREDLRVFEQN